MRPADPGRAQVLRPQGYGCAVRSQRHAAPGHPLRRRPEGGLCPGRRTCRTSSRWAARLARTGLEAEAERICDLHARLAAAIPGLLLNGHDSERLPNTLNLSFPGVAGWQLLEGVPEIAASTGSACHAGQHAASGVLGAMGLSAERASGAVRLSLGRFTTETETGAAAAALIAAWQRLAASG